MRPVPYIGVTGVNSPRHVTQILKVMPEDSPHQLMIGVLVSRQSLKGTTNRRYPGPERFSQIFSPHPKAFNVLHYYSDKVDTQAIVDDLAFADAMAGPYCHGVQLNLAWPDPQLLELYKEVSRGKKIILQCGPLALKEIGQSGDALVARLQNYQELADYVLIDPSGGAGRDFDPDQVQQYFECLERISGIGFGVAGGLEAANLYRLRPLIAQFGPFSLDAEGRMRDKNDLFKPGAARAYVRDGAGLFKQYTSSA